MLTRRIKRALAASSKALFISVSITPGATAFTRIPREANSMENVSVAESTAALDDPYDNWPGFPSIPVTLDTFTTDPPPVRSIILVTYCVI